MSRPPTWRHERVGGPRARQGVRRAAGDVVGGSRGGAGRAAADHRPQRRRQDDAVQPDHRRAAPGRRGHLGLARTYQIITLFPRETLLGNITLSLLGLSRLRWNPCVALRRQAGLVARAREVLAQVGLESLADRPLAQTSYGERRRVEIAMALAQHPRVLLLDEPFAGLSIEERRDVLRLVTGIPRDVTIVMIEHDMDVALDFAERITVLHFGEVVVEGTR